MSISTDREQFWRETFDTFTAMVLFFQRVAEPLDILPSGGETPSPEIDAACDAWIKSRSESWMDSPLPPPELRAWLWVRATCAERHARNSLAMGEAAMMSLNIPQRVVFFMVDSWRSQFQEQWENKSPEQN